MAKKRQYGNDSISQLKGADRVRKRPAVIFGSDSLEGCQHSIFEIISNSIDEAREGFGDKIIITKYLDCSIEVQDFGRGLPVDYNSKEQRFNWELVFNELYAGGKYDTNEGGSYEYSLGLNGLGLCATQYASEYMEAEIHSGGYRYYLTFKHGEPVGEMIKEEYFKKDTGTRIKWRPDLKVFTEIDVPVSYFTETLKRQSVVNSGIRFIFKNQLTETKFETTEFLYENGIQDYVQEYCGEDAFTSIQVWHTEKRGRDRRGLMFFKQKTTKGVLS
ncbi:MAG: DNA topoisomerase 4 subunit B [Firmicutes bacterium ADurb.Bin300]|nr:MAG: DNA topoisomerase 4 subunit B [Firmicutes bacterium ADurb.Bin300]